MPYPPCAGFGYLGQASCRVAHDGQKGIQRQPHQRSHHLQDTTALVEELNQIDRHAEKISVPLSYADELYALRSNISLVRQKLQRKAGN